MKLKFLLLAVTGMAVSGCQSAEEIKASFAQATPATASVKAQIVHDARDFLFDPYSIRDAEISYVQFNNRSGLHWLCVKANAKNRMGAYTGRQAIEVWVKDGKLAGNVPNSVACGNPSMRWQPFPELENLKNI